MRGHTRVAFLALLLVVLTASGAVPAAPARGASSSQVYLPLVANGLGSGTGSLQVTISELPSSSSADVSVVGPNPATTSYHLTQSQTLTLPAGTYTVSANGVRVGSATYYATVPSTTVVVSGGTTGGVTVSYQDVVPDTTKVLSSGALSTISAVSPDYSTVTFAGGSALPALAPGDVLVAGVSPQTPYGMLRKVSTVSTSGGTVTVTTAPATLLDAAPQGSLDIQTTLTAADIPTSAGLRSQAVGGPIVQAIQQSVTCSSGATIQVGGSISVVPSFDFSAQWGGLSNPVVTQALFTGSVTETAQLAASAHAGANCTLGPVPLGPPIRFAPMTYLVGPVPVVVVPVLQFELNADGSVSADAATSVTQQATAKAGIQYANGTYSPVSQLSNSFTYDPPSASSSGSLNSSVGPKLDLLLYDAAGPEISIDATVAFSFDSTKAPPCTLDAGIEAGGGLVVPVLKLDDTNPSILSATKTLYQCPPPNLLVQGHVRDGGTGTGIGNATVFLMALSTHYTAQTDSSGYYSLRVPSDKYDAVVFGYPASRPYTYTQRGIVGFDGSGQANVTAPDILLDRNNATITGFVLDTSSNQMLTNGAAEALLDLGHGVEYNRDYDGNAASTDSSGTYTIPAASRSYPGIVVERTACANVNISSGAISLSPGQTLTLNYGLGPC